MRNNAATFSHPETIRKIRAALWLARIEAVKKSKQTGKAHMGTQYVRNRKGISYLRVSVGKDKRGFWVHIWGDQSRDITGLVLAGAIRANRGLTKCK